MATEFDIYSKDGTPVRAKYLEVHGRRVQDASGQPYIVPADFDWDTYVGKFQTFRALVTAGSLTAASTIAGIGEKLRFLFNEFHTDWPGSPSDIQRTYNGKRGTEEGDLVFAFRRAASFLYGAACAATGLPLQGALAGGGVQNRWSRRNNNDVDLSGKNWNAPENVPNIENGWNYYMNGGPASSGKPREGKSGDKSERQTMPQPGPRAEASEWMQPATDVRAASAPNHFGRIEGWTRDPVATTGRNLLASTPPLDQKAPLAGPGQYSFSGTFAPTTALPSGNIIELRPVSASGFQGDGDFIDQTRQPKAAPARQGYSLKDKLGFLGNVHAVAKPVSEETGLSLPFILAQAAYESGWGRNINGNNLFNLRPGGNWEGPTFTKNGKDYRSYPSHDESLRDYVEYLRAVNKEMFMPDVREDTDKLARLIQHSGYSDDPSYGMGIMATARTPLMKRALRQFDKWPPDKP